MDTIALHHPQYSALMSVYINDEPVWLTEAIESILVQTWKPEEFLIVEDGPVQESVHEVLRQYKSKYPDLFRIEVLPQNRGLGLAMRYGVEKCRNEWIARMDADDISGPTRCEEELRKALELGADIVGCDCEEFIDSVSNPQTKRQFPETHEEIVRFSRRRTPFCHPSVMMRKEAVLAAGNYQDEWLLEDYDLFVRMLEHGSVGYNVKKTLFHIRSSKDFYNRRSGLKYAMRLVAFNGKLLRKGWMHPMDFFVRSCGNLFVGLAPTAVRVWIYKRFLRK